MKLCFRRPLTPLRFWNTSSVDMLRRYLEAIVLLGDHWFFITNVDVFVHNRRTLDDCTHNNTVQFRQTAEAHIRPKTTYGSDHYELSLYIGHLELLVIGGFIGDIVSNRCSAFLGSSIRGLPNTLQQSHTTSKILARADDPVEHTASNRFLRQYAKYCSRFLWSFHSKCFVLKGFHPANPLDFSSHPSVTSLKRYQTHSIVSNILGCIARSNVTKDDLLQLVFMCQTNASFPKVSSTTATTYFSAVKAALPKAAGKTTYITRIIAILEFLEQAVETNDKPNNLLSELAALKQMTIALMNDGYAVALKSANEKIIAEFISAHPIYKLTPM